MKLPDKLPPHAAEPIESWGTRFALAEFRKRGIIANVEGYPRLLVMMPGGRLCYIDPEQGDLVRPL